MQLAYENNTALSFVQYIMTCVCEGTLKILQKIDLRDNFILV